LTTYNLEFHEDALKEWRKLDGNIKQQFKTKLAERLRNPRVPSAQLRGKDMQDTYKIKLRDIGSPKLPQTG
jgi:mRNA interferase RelE/StbE